MQKSTLTLNKIAIFHKKLAKFTRSNLKTLFFTIRKSRILGTLLFLVLKSIIFMTKFSHHFLIIFAKLTLSRFCQKVKKIDNNQRAIFVFCSKYPAKIDAIHQKTAATYAPKSYKTSQIHANHTSKKPQNRSNPHQKPPNMQKWAGIALKNSHTHPTPTSHLITCFGRYWCLNLRHRS